MVEWSGMNKEIEAKPFLKWVGGKGQLLSQLKTIFPKKYNTYYEPFVGGGAVFFELKPKKAHISDINKVLINTFLMIKNDSEKLIKSLKKIEKEFLSKNEKEREKFYYDIRNKFNSLKSDDSKKVVYFIFLNRTAFNGVYRENSKGLFNVPMGKYKNPKILNEENIKSVSEYLKNTKITCDSFFNSVKKAKRGDFVYFDPPYYPISETSKFTTYHKDNFNKEDQIKLRDLFVELDKKGVLCMLSNSNTSFIREIYSKYKQIPVYASRMINSKAEKRGKISELVIINY